jgi:hypothetical protein
MGSTRREEYRQPEERTLADLMVGNRVIVQHMVGPDADPDRPDEEVRGQPQAATGAFWLHAISSQGIELSRSLKGEGSEVFLVPWASLLVLDGRPRGELEQEAREAFAIDREGLLERLGDPQQDDRNVGLDARWYLSYTPTTGK